MRLELPMKKIKICFFIDNFVFGGDVKFFFNLISPFARYRNSVSVLCNDFDVKTKIFYNPIKRNCNFYFQSINSYSKFFFKNRDNIFIKIINKILYSFLPLKILYFVLKYKKFLKSIKPDIVISCNGGYPGSAKCLAVNYASKLLGLSSVMIIASIPGKKNNFFSIYESLIDILTKKSVSKLFTNSKHQLNLLHLKRNIARNKITVIYNGLKINKKKFKKINFKKKIINIGVISRLDKTKNLEKIIELIFNLRNETKIFRLMIVGDGEQKENLIRITKKFNVIDRVNFVGFIDNNKINSYLRKMDIFIFPSELEGLPYSVLEAINEGVPVISANSGGLNKVMLNKKQILCASPLTVLKLKECLFKYINNSKFADDLRRNAFLKLNLLFNINKMEFLFKKYIFQIISNDKINYKKNT
jgi:glycosyltransferase involved in cell wall biosynthesis